MRDKISIIVLIIGLIIISFSTLGSIGFGLYLWGGSGVVLAVAAWTAFKLWLSTVFGGLCLVIIGIFFIK